MPLRSIMVFIIPFFIIVGVPSPADSAGIHSRVACCTKYDDIVVTYEAIEGYWNQTDLAHCRIEAIIFYTSIPGHREVCANPKDKWVQDAVKRLSGKETKKTEKKSHAWRKGIFLQY
ncbi:PREDICTED: C-C motif chemokine 7-like [Cyprinodon variegatus]|uniref:C-C motif chemokine 7-like n=1 Tax=Cyprinodon variegatus TaxID=28743 RepID=UPI0007427357|nr:PREDICTED: C-C motif chemokine 7-like [Cyprinodon variegatus]